LDFYSKSKVTTPCSKRTLSASFQLWYANPGREVEKGEGSDSLEKGEGEGGGLSERIGEKACGIWKNDDHSTLLWTKDEERSR
jgi:hypothetical protein